MAIEAIHLNEEGIKSLLSLVIAPSYTGTALTTDSVNLIDEDDAGRVLAALLKHVTDASRTDTDEHFNEVGATDRKEGHLGLASDCFGQKCLTRTRRADHEHTFRNLTANALEFLRILEEIDDLRDLLLSLITTRNIFEGGRVFLAGEHLSFAFAKAHSSLTSTLELTHEEEVEETND